jgi:hypothetical protein
MDLPAPNAVQHHPPSECSLERVGGFLKTYGIGGELWLIAGVRREEKEVGMLANCIRGQQHEGLVPACVSPYVSRLVLGHGFGAYPAPYGAALFCFGCATLRVTVSVPDPP